MDVDIDAGVSADVSASNALSKILSWLRVGKVPVIVLLVIFLTAFGLGGLYLQNVMDDMFGYLLPSAVASGIAICIALPITRFCGGIVERIIPKDETDAVSVKTLIGRVATILVGTAATDSSAEAKVKDQHGQTHYIMVQPDADEETFTAGDDVLLVRKAGSVFYVIKNTNMNLSDEG
jgi:hypothetical protein